MINEIEKKKRWFFHSLYLVPVIFVPLFLYLSGQIICAKSFPSLKRVGGDLVVQVPDEISSLDSQASFTEIEKLIIRNVQEGLLAYDPNGQIVPRLATSLPQSTGKNKWLISLRKGVFFHDGSELEAKDVVFTFNRLKKSTLTISSRDVLGTLNSIKAIDRYGLEFTTEGACPNLSDLLTRAEMFPLSVEALETYGNNYGKVILIGTGPFRFQCWHRNKQIVLVKNSNYRDPSIPYLNSISFELISSSLGKMKFLSSMQAHVTLDLSPDEAAAIDKRQDINLYHTEGRRLVQIYLNLDIPPFNKKSLRVALAHGIDTQGMIKEVFKEFASRADSCIPVWSWAHQSEYRPVEYDPEKVLTILKLEGYDREHPFSFSLMISEDPVFSAIARYIRDSLAKMAIIIDIIPLPKSELFNYIYGRNGRNRERFQAALEDWEDFRYERDPWQFTAELYASTSPFNKVRFCDLVLDNIFEEIKMAESAFVQQELYFAAERRIMNSILSIYLCYPHHIHAAQSRVRNIRVNPLAEIEFKRVWLLK